MTDTEYRIPYELQGIWQEASEFFSVCDILHGESDKYAKATIDKLSVKFRLDLPQRFRQDYLTFSKFKPELLQSKSEKENYAWAYKYGAFTEILQDIQKDLAGESDEAIEAKENSFYYQDAFDSYIHSNGNKNFMDFLKI